ARRPPPRRPARRGARRRPPAAGAAAHRDHRGAGRGGARALPLDGAVGDHRRGARRGDRHLPAPAVRDAAARGAAARARRGARPRGRGAAGGRGAGVQLRRDRAGGPLPVEPRRGGGAPHHRRAAPLPRARRPGHDGRRAPHRGDRRRLRRRGAGARAAGDRAALGGRDDLPLHRGVRLHRRPARGRLRAGAHPGALRRARGRARDQRARRALRRHLRDARHAGGEVARDPRDERRLPRAARGAARGAELHHRLLPDRRLVVGVRAGGGLAARVPRRAGPGARDGGHRRPLQHRLRLDVPAPAARGREVARAQLLLDVRGPRHRRLRLRARRRAPRPPAHRAAQGGDRHREHAGELAPRRDRRAAAPGRRAGGERRV
ncbi:MAG: hypothetical protein AVDCRST_MAG40-1155, partial [uncultured Gemmatimonadaceae bacterium]